MPGAYRHTVRAVTLTSSRWLRAVALGVVVIGSGILAVQLHRNGQTQGDDFALYLRQARSLFDGDIGAVLADNRFAVLNSDDAFSPLAYPWGWPLLLSPFVHLWGYDYDRLKLVEVAVFMTWLVLLHGIVRRRVGRLPALAIVAVVGTAPVFLVYTDQLLTEFPHLATVALFIWWYDRIRSRATLLTASRGDLIALGAMVTLVFNMRREGIVLLGVIAAMQLYDLVASIDGRRSPAALAGRVRANWQAIVTPFLAFAVATTLFQLLLPTALLPENGNSTSFIDNRLGEFPGTLTDQLGLGQHPLVGIAILGLAAAGAVIGVRRRPALDGPLLLLALGSTLLISTHLRKVDRYWFQVTPWVIYFAAVALVELERTRVPPPAAHRAVRRNRAARRDRRRPPRGVARQGRRRPRLRRRRPHPVGTEQPAGVSGLRRSRRAHPTRCDHRLLPFSHDDTADGSPLVPDERPRTHHPERRLLRAASGFHVLATRSVRERRPTRRIRGGLVGRHVDPLADTHARRLTVPHGV